MKKIHVIYIGVIMGLFGCSPTYTLKSLLKEAEETRESAIKISSNKGAIESTIKAFDIAFSAYTKESVISAIDVIYSENAFLNDRIHSVRGRDKIKEYFSSTFEKVDGASFSIQNITYGEKDVFLQWVMNIDFKGQKNESSFLGLSILRFDEEGKVLYHQDYWDYSELLSQIGVVKNIVNYAKKKS